VAAPASKVFLFRYYTNLFRSEGKRVKKTIPRTSNTMCYDFEVGFPITQNNNAFSGLSRLQKLGTVLRKP